MAFLAASWQQLLSGEDLTFTGFLLVVILVGGGAWGVASWVRTTYWVGDDELRIDTGVISRQSRRIRVDRLQGIDIIQPFVARLFGLAELRFDLAGGDREGTLAFLPLAEARQLRQQLLLLRDAHRDETASLEQPAPGGALPGAVPTPGSVPPPGVPEELQQPLAKLDLGRLLASLALSGETIAGALAAAAFGLGALFTGTGVVVVGGLVPALLGLGLALARKLTSYYGFVVSRSPGAMHVRRGMFSLARQTIALHRVQGVVVHEPLLWRPLGWARLEVSLAGYQGGSSDQVQASSVLMPVAPREECLWLAREALRGLDGAQVPLVGVPRRARWFAPFFWRTYGVGMDERVVVGCRGWFTRRMDVVPQARVQSVRIEQGPLQRRLGLADLCVDIPPGPVRLRGSQRDAVHMHDEVGRVVALSRAARRAG
ncbi:PH domain-containing protein [Microbacterium sp.]|uniref:PH domain-containing protein n=1 Tax=Microbacterium sp. TaxID=51671 RepID=UPI003735BE78